MRKTGRLIAIMMAISLSVCLLTGCGSGNYCEHVLMDPNYSHSLISEVEATCISNGLNLYECSCGKLHKVVVSAAGHTWEDTTDGNMQVCATCGMTRRNEEGNHG